MMYTERINMEDDIKLNPYGVGILILYCVMWGVLIYYRI